MFILSTQNLSEEKNFSCVVVIDRRRNKRAARGKFECIFKQRNPFCGNVFGKAVSLGIRGKGLQASQTTSRKL